MTNRRETKGIHKKDKGIHYFDYFISVPITFAQITIHPPIFFEGQTDTKRNVPAMSHTILQNLKKCIKRNQYLRILNQSISDNINSITIIK